MQVTLQLALRPIWEEIDALVAYILHQMRAHAESAHIDTPDKLFEYFLMDVQMEPCMETSRIRHALVFGANHAVGAVGDFKGSAHRGEVFRRLGGRITLEVVRVGKGEGFLGRNRRFALVLAGRGSERIEAIRIHLCSEAVARPLAVAQSNKLLLRARSPYVEVGGRQIGRDLERERLRLFGVDWQEFDEPHRSNRQRRLCRGPW